MDQINHLALNIKKLSIALDSQSMENNLLRDEIEQRDQLAVSLRSEILALQIRLQARDAECEGIISKYAEAVSRLDGVEQLLQKKSAEAVAISDWAVGLRTQIAAKQAELMQLSNWGNGIARSPGVYLIRRSLSRVARFVYRLLPLPASQKHRIARKLRRWFGRSEQVRAVAPLVVAHTAATEAAQSPLASVHGVPPQQLDVPAVFVFGVIDWHFRIQRPQNLAKELARAGQATFYISNHFIDDDTPGFSVERLDSESELFQIQLHVSGAPAIYYAPPPSEVIVQLCQSLAMLIQWANTKSIHSIVQHAYWFPVARRLPNSTLIYDCMDHHEGFGNVAQELLDLEVALMRRADLLVATSEWIEQHGKRQNSNVAVIRNAGEYSFFSQRPQSVYQDVQGRKIIGYYGAIAEWFDLELVKQVALRFPECLVLLIGADTVNAKKYFKGVANISMLGEVPYATLPHYLYAMDVCLLPFQVIPLTLATNPVKVYEYLSAGKSVVSIKLPELSQFAGLVRVASSVNEFLTAVSASLGEDPQDNTLREERQAFAANQTWRHRAVSLREAVESLPLPKVSVVVLTYNNLELTKACLDSVVRNSDYPNLEIIVVDNQSTDDTPQFLGLWGAEAANRKVILNEENSGFSAGNNIGLAAATGDYLVVLNNDTVVTQGWIRGMLRHLQENADVGIIGPVTNNIGNEAKVDLSYSDLDVMHLKAAEHTLAHMGVWFEINTLAFFCVMIPRTTYQQIGGLCEEYGLGFFEDDDYCRRVQQLGLRAACAEDVFVHHHLSASFNKLGADRKQALFERNKAIYEGKWGTWTPHRYRDQ